MQYSVIARLDPHSILKYVCENERESEDKTIFFLKPLSISEYMQCESIDKEHSVKSGSFALKALKYGLIGWDNFVDEDNKVIPFDLVNFKFIPFKIQDELSEEITKISELESDLSDELRLVARWSDWLEKNEKKKYQWECEFCIEKKLFEKRNCSGLLPKKCVKCHNETLEDECEKCGEKTISQFKFRFSPKVDDFVSRCPVALLTPRAIQLTNVINFVDNSKSLPFKGGAFEQSNFFYLVRMVVLSEQNSILKRELDKKPDFNKISQESNRYGKKNKF